MKISLENIYIMILIMYLLMKIIVIRFITNFLYPKKNLIMIS